MAVCAYHGQLLKGELNSIFGQCTLEKMKKDEQYVFVVFVVCNAILTSYSLYSTQFVAVPRAEGFVPS